MNQDSQTPVPGQGNEPQPQKAPVQSSPPKKESRPAQPDYKVEEESVFPEQGAGFQPRGLKPKSLNKKKLAIGIIAGILIVLVGFTVVLATKIWNPSWNPFSPNPTKILKQALENMSELDTVHTKIVVGMDIEEGGEFSSIKGIVDADLDITDKDNPKSQMDYDIKIKVPGTEIEMIIGTEMRTMDDVIYFRITSIPFIFNMYLSQIGLDISQWQNKWYHLDPEELGVSMAGLGLSSDDKLALTNDLQELYLEYLPAKPIKRLAEGEIDGQATYHFLMSLDKENLKQFVVKLPLVLEKYDTFQTQGFTEEEEQEMFTDIDEFFEKTGGIEFEIFIGKTDKLIYLITWQDYLSATLLGEEESGGVDLDVSIEFSDFNEPVEILTPEGSDSIIEVFMGMMSMFNNSALGSGPLKAKDARIRVDINQLRTQAEMIWVDNSSYAPLCSGGRLNTIRPELKALRDDVVLQGSDVTCYANTSNYCLSANLQSESVYFCLDSDGRAIETESNTNPCTYQMQCIE